MDPSTLTEDVLLPGSVSASTRASLVDFWQRRADGERTTAEAMRHVREDLTILGAPPELRALADRAIDDELRHTIWCQHVVANLTRKDPPAPRIHGDEPLAFSGATEAENRILRVVFTGCVSETIALHVLRESQPDIEPAPLRNINRQHMSEEVGHAQLGWAALAWLVHHASLRRDARALLARALPNLIRFGCESWRAGGRDEHPELARVGFLHVRHIERGIERALSEVIYPGFEHHEIVA